MFGFGCAVAQGIASRASMSGFGMSSWPPERRPQFTALLQPEVPHNQGRRIPGLERIKLARIGLLEKVPSATVWIVQGRRRDFKTQVHPVIDGVGSNLL